MKFYMPFEKVEAQDDGTVKVSGYASSEAVDSHGETIKADAMRAAIPDYMAFGGTGALREMHQPIAAGVVLKAEVEADGRTHVETHVVDLAAAKKVVNRVYKGFSIGGKVTERDGKVIKGLQLREISLVDRPANPDATFTIMKVDDVQDEAETSAADDLKKLAADADTRLAKMADDMSILAKSMNGLTTAIAKVGAENADLRKSLGEVTAKIEAIEKMAAPAKGVVTTITKQGENGGDAPNAMSPADVQKALADMKPEDAAMLVMKASLMNGKSLDDKAA